MNLRGIAILFAVVAFIGDASAGLTDALEFAGPIAGDVVGGHDLRRPARTIAPGESTAFDLRIARNQPITIELEELYDREPGVTAYLVHVDGVKTAFRTWQGCGAGPIHFFVDVPPRESELVAVRVQNVGRLPLHLGRAWAFAGLDASLDVPCRIAPTVRLRGDMSADLASLQKIAASLKDHPHIRPAWTTHLAYARWNDARFAERLDHALRLAELADLPVQLCFDTWWGSTPTGPDGRGGFWTDVEYQQVVYDATARRMTLTTPNRWSNLPWLTVNHPDLNAHKLARLRHAMSVLRDRVAELSARCKRNLILAINLDNEPVYWASGGAGLGMNTIQADFNPRTVEAAAKARVTLDPTDGLSPGERVWLQKNLLDYNAMIANAAYEALGPDPLRDDIYTQAMVAHPKLQFPLADETTALWESAAPAAVRVGGEWNRDTLAEQQAVTRMLALGRSAAVNAECSNDASETSGVRLGYALGQRFYTPYNFPLDQLAAAGAGLRDVNAATLAQPIFENAVREHDFAGDAWKASVADHGGLTIEPLGHAAATCASPQSLTEPGFLAYQLEVPPGGLSAVELFGRAIDHGNKDNDRVAIRVLVDGVEAGRLHDRDLNAVHRIDLAAATRGKSKVDIRLELDPGGIALRQWCTLWKVRFTAAWPEEFTRDLPPQERSLVTVRRQSLLVSWRRDAELAIARPGTEAAKAKQAYDRGDYVTAYALANEAAASHATPTSTPTTKPSVDRTPAPAAIAAAAREQLTGVVTAIRQMTPYDMPAITLDADGVSRVIHPTAPLHLGEKETNFRATPLGEVSLRVGDRVRIRYAKATGRVFELWKL